MNKIEMDVLMALKNKPHDNQRSLAAYCKCSLGAINKAIKNLYTEKLINKNNEWTGLSYELAAKTSPKNAIILAAGSGSRMAPYDLPKGLLVVNNQSLIERLILQLKEVGINHIYIVVGYKKEKFEFLMDRYDVTLIYNPFYAQRSNLTSLSLVSNYIDNSYILPSDFYCVTNPFSSVELYAWYAISNEQVDDYGVNVTSHALFKKNGQGKGDKMTGFAYFCGQSQIYFIHALNVMSESPDFHHAYWEDVLFSNKIPIYAKLVNKQDFIEINTYAELQDIDCSSRSLQNKAISLIEEIFNVDHSAIKEVQYLKKGMTNRSFSFVIDYQKYIMRIPGEGTSQLINRQREYDVYQVLKSTKISDEVVYLNPDNGFKITKFMNLIRNAQADSFEDVSLCMQALRSFHQSNLKVNHFFDVFEQIEFYESLWKRTQSDFLDYEKTKSNVLSLKTWIDSIQKETCLCHIDAVPDNFLIDDKGDVYLIDWEYAAMQDPHIDIAMFAIYALYDKEKIDKLIDLYFEHNCLVISRIKIYAYIAICGLLWSNWCEYKSDLGVEFGEYSIKQYRYAKDFYRIVERERMAHDL